MKNVMLALGFLPFLAVAAAAQTAADSDVSYKDLAIGHRVEITFRNGSTIMGTLVAPPGGPKAASIDYERASALTIDVSLEYPGLDGTMTTAKTEIRKLRTLQPLTAEQRREIEKQKQRLADDRRAALAKPPAKPEPEAAPAPAPKPPAEPSKEEIELKKAQEIYKKFPPPDWSSERRNAIRLKTLRGQALTAPEAEFDQNFALWEKGRDAQKQPAEPKKP